MVTVKTGDRLKFVCRFTHQGAAFSGAYIRVAIGQKGAVSFDEALGHNVTSSSLSVLYDLVPTLYEVPLIITIQSNLGPGKWEAYAKLTGIPGADLYWYGPIDDIIVEEAAALFSNLTVTYTKL